MKTITKGIAVAGMLVALGAGGWQALAAGPGMQGAGPGTGPGAMGGGIMGGAMMRGGMMAGSFADPATRLPAWKSDIGIRPDQETAWTTYAGAVKEITAKLQAGHRAMAGATVRDMTALQPLCQQQAASFTALRQAATTLLGSLDANQVSRAQAVLPGLAFRGGMGGMMGGRMM